MTMGLYEDLSVYAGEPYFLHYQYKYQHEVQRVTHRPYLLITPTMLRVRALPQELRTECQGFGINFRT